MAVKLFIDPIALGFEVHRVSGSEFLVKCPYHDDVHPSAYFNAREGVFYCFSCGASRSARQVAKDLGGEIKKVAWVNVKGAEITAEAVDWSTILRAPLATDSEYLEQRGIGEEAIVHFGIRSLPNAIAFLIDDVHGQVVGAQLRFIKPGGPKYLLYGKRTAVWPMHMMMKLPYADPNVFLVEGAFGTVNAWQHGVKALSTMGAAAVDEAVWWMIQKFPDFRVLFDDDFSGYLGAGRACVLSRLHARVILPGGEADEMTKEEWQAALLNRGSVDFQVMGAYSGDRKRFHKLVWKGHNT